MLSLGWLLDGYVIYSNYTIEYAFDATFQISKIKRPAPNSTSRKCRKLFRLWWVKSFFSKYTENSSVIQLINCWLSRNVALCQQALPHWSYQTSSQGSGHHNLHYGINLFQKVAGFLGHHSYYFLLQGVFE